MDAFRACPGCRRHVRVGESSCPFCAASLPPVTVRSVTWPRLARGAMLAFGATLAVNCGSEVTVPADDDQGTGAGAAGAGGTEAASAGAGGEGGEGVGASASVGGAGMGGVAPPYGTPGVGGAASGGAPASGGAGGETSDGGGFPLYGAAPFPDDDDSL